MGVTYDDTGGGSGGTSSGGRWGDPGGIIEKIRNRNATAVGSIYDALPPNIRENGVQIDEFHWLDPATGTVYELATTAKGEPTFKMLSDADSKRFLGSVGGGSGGSGGGSGGSGSRLASDDPRYWANQDRQFALEVAQLEAQLMNSGLDAESARRQALTTLITNRNNTAVDIGNLSASVAKTSAEYAARPGDAYAEAYYANQVGGPTPFGDIANKHFGEYGKTLAEKGERIFSPVQADIQQARLYRDSIPPLDFLGPEQRTSLNLPPTPAQQLTGDVAMQPVGANTPAATTDPLTALTDRLKAMSPEEQNAFQRYTTIASGHGWQAPKPFAKGGEINFDDIYDNRDKPGYSPTSSEGGTNMQIHERALIVGESGHVYGTLGEKREDGSIRSEILQIKVPPSEKEKDKKLKEGNKAIVESQKKTLASFATGGSVAATPDDLYEVFNKYLSSFTGEHGGGGTPTPFGGTRHVAGALANEAAINPMVKRQLESTYDAMGIRPDQLWADVLRYTPSSAQRQGQTNVRAGFL